MVCDLEREAAGGKLGGLTETTMAQIGSKDFKKKKAHVQADAKAAKTHVRAPSTSRNKPKAASRCKPK